jgi:hypothetical protein
MKRKITAMIALGLCLVFVLSVAFTAQADDMPVQDSSSASEASSVSETSEDPAAQETSESSQTQETSEISETQESSQTQETSEISETQEASETIETSQTTEDPEADDTEDISETETQTEQVLTENPVGNIEGMNISLINELDTDFTEVYVRPSMTEAWSENLLKEGYVWKAGGEAKMVVPEGFNESSLGLFDVKVVSADGTASEIIFVPFIDDVRGDMYMNDGVVLISILDERIVAEETYVSSEEIMQDHEASKEALKEALEAEVSNN